MDLRQYLDSTGIKHRFFAQKMGISTSTLHALLKKRSLPSMKLAYDIEIQTSKAVTLYDWLTDYMPKAKSNTVMDPLGNIEYL